jgi:hypothetical protein
MPDAAWQGEHGSTGMSRYDIVCVHTIVGYAPAHAAHFSTNGAGDIYQSRDTAYRSAANLHGNHRIIAIENADHGSPFPGWGGSDVPDFSEAQVESIAKILAWAYHTHGIPLTPCPDSRSGSRGIAYHRQGCDGNFGGYAYGGRVPGGELWSKAYGKVCPGDRRITTLLTRIIPRAQQIAGLAPPPPPPPSLLKDDDMDTLVTAELGDHFYVAGIGGDGNVHTKVWWPGGWADWHPIFPEGSKFTRVGFQPFRGIQMQYVAHGYDGSVYKRVHVPYVGWGDPEHLGGWIAPNADWRVGDPTT